MSYAGQLLSQLKGTKFYKLAEAAIGEAGVQATRSAESDFEARLTGTEGMTTEGLDLWRRMVSEWLCIVSINYSASGWACHIQCPDTDHVASAGHIDPESALHGCIEKWAIKIRAARPHLITEGVTVP